MRTYPYIGGDVGEVGNVSQNSNVYLHKGTAKCLTSHEVRKDELWMRVDGVNDIAHISINN